MSDPCLFCPLPDCDEDSIECPLHADERVQAAALFVVKDSSGQTIRAEAMVRRELMQEAI